MVRCSRCLGVCPLPYANLPTLPTSAHCSAWTTFINTQVRGVQNAVIEVQHTALWSHSVNTPVLAP
jgi:hypothetical protein